MNTKRAGTHDFYCLQLLTIYTPDTGVTIIIKFTHVIFIIIIIIIIICRTILS